MGCVGKDQLDAVSKYLDQAEDSNAFRILVLHHHILPAMYAEELKMNPMYSIMTDSGRLLEFIQQKHINVVLHGHVHRDFYAELITKKNDNKKHKVYIVGIGSSGIEARALSDGRTNMFGILNFEKDALIIEGRTLKPTGEAGQSLFTHTIPYKENLN